jgi:hypothetical protein
MVELAPTDLADLKTALDGVEVHGARLPEMVLKMSGL